MAALDRKAAALEAREAVRSELFAAGANGDLLDGAEALFRRDHEIKVERGQVLVASPFGPITLAAAVAEWLRTPAAAPYGAGRARLR